jgi:hypothetical protein
MPSKICTWVLALVLVGGPTSAAAIGYRHTCESLLIAASRDLPDTLRLVDLSLIDLSNSYSPMNSYRGRPLVHLKFEGKQNAQAFRSQIHEAIELFLKNTSPIEPAPGLSKDDLSLLKQYADLWISAHTEKTTGDLNFQKKHHSSQEEIKALKALERLSDQTVLVGRPSFDEMMPIPQFRFNKTKPYLNFKVIPHKKGDGFELVLIHNTTRAGPRTDLNDRMFYIAVEHIFQKQIQLALPNISYNFLDIDLFNPKVQKTISLTKLNNALIQAGETTKGSIDPFEISKKLVLEVNLSMFLLITHDYHLSNNIAAGRMDEFKAKNQFKKPEEIDFFYRFFKSYNDSYYKDTTATDQIKVFGWSQFLDFARLNTENFDEQAWLAAIEDIKNKIKLKDQRYIEHQDHFDQADLFFSDYSFFSGRLNMPSMSIGHQLDYSMFERELSLNKIRINFLRIEFEAHDSDLEKGELREPHLDLLVSLLSEKLDD